jgi:hypothetical protein
METRQVRVYSHFNMTEVFFADKDMFMSTRVFDDFFKRGKFVFNWKEVPWYSNLKQ